MLCEFVDICLVISVAIYAFVETYERGIRPDKRGARESFVECGAFIPFLQLRFVLLVYKLCSNLLLTFDAILFIISISHFYGDVMLLEFLRKFLVKINFVYTL